VNPSLAYVGLGSNLAHPRRQVARAVLRLARLPATTLLRVSRNYVSAPVDCAQPQSDYVNAVAALRTRLSPRALLGQLLAIERRQQRRRGRNDGRNAPRTLDLDLLLYGRRRVRTPTLTVPHPRMDRRAFVLRPLADIAPTITIPGRGLARRLLPRLTQQRIAATRRHVLP
jgi:2-amino-4-hydroxy-6-hydroxymethyldihydropteridine diphosphokinase